MLEPKQGTVPLTGDVMLAFMPLFLALGLVLMIGCANVANLLLAREQSPAGGLLASDWRLARRGAPVIWQLLTESLLLALVSAALAFGISRLVLTGVVYAVTTTFPPEIGNLRIAVPPADWRVALFLVAGAMASTLFFALAPALQATRLELVRAIRGEVVRDGRPGRAPECARRAAGDRICAGGVEKRRPHRHGIAERTCRQDSRFAAALMITIAPTIARAAPSRSELVGR